MSWSEINDTNILNQALALAKGSYQRDLLLGVENLSGSSLKGKASKWSTSYKRSRYAILKRMTNAGIPWSEKRGDHNRRILVIG